MGEREETSREDQTTEYKVKGSFLVVDLMRCKWRAKREMKVSP